MHKSLADPIGKAFFMGDNCTLSYVFVIFFFFLRDNSISEKESFFLEAGLAYYVVRGAALEHACQQYPENGVYTGAAPPALNGLICQYRQLRLGQAFFSFATGKI